MTGTPRGPAATRARAARTARLARVALACALACALAAVAPACSREHIAPGPGPGDVVLVVVDTLRARSLSLHGYERDTSPSLVALARESVTYERAVTPATWTVPAHASLLTGLWPSFHGAERVPDDRLLALPMSPDAATLGELLRAQGFRTGALVANGTYLSSLFGFDRGFDHWFEDHDFIRAERMLDAAAAWLAEQPGKAFLLVNVLDPHEPFEPLPPFHERFPGRDARFGTMLGELVRAGRPLTPAMRAHFLSQYDGEIAFTDRALGRFFERLRALGRWDASLVIVTSDHGELLGEHGLVGHGTEPYEPLVHVPLVVKYPYARGAGTRIGRRVSTLGVFATVLATAGVAPPAGVQSVPLDEPHDVYVEDVGHDGERVRVAYAGERKLVVRARADGTRHRLLYDLASDPDEERPDLAPAQHDALVASLDAFAALPRPRNAAPRPVIDPEREARLRALGYVR